MFCTGPKFFNPENTDFGFGILVGYDLKLLKFYNRQVSSYFFYD